MMTRFDQAVVALVDGTPAAANAAWRAALVARDHCIPLRVLHDETRAGNGANEAPSLVPALRARLGIAVELQPVAGDALQAVVRAARDASLLVVGSGRGNLLREFVLGTQAERLLRLARVPVLVVKRPATGGYRRVLVPVDLAPEAGQVIAMAGLFSRDPRMEVLHALCLRNEVPLRVAEVPEAVLRRQRNRTAERARALLEEWIAEAGMAPHGAQAAVTFGDAAAAVLARERAMRAELVVVGKRQRGLLADFFLGGVTQRLLASARADVLALPLGGGREAAVLRLRAALPAEGRAS